MKSNCYFEECKDCLYRKHNDDLLCCLTNRLGLAFHELLKELPIINKFIDSYKYCHYFEKEQGVYRGYRAKILIVDDLCDIDKEELKEILNKKGENND